MKSRVRTLVIVLAGGAGGRLELLTHERAKPAVSFAGTHRLIDFPLSNCLNSGLPDVWIAQQFNPISLSDHLANGRPWDLDRTAGGLLILQPRMGHDGRDGFPKGTADAVWRNAPMIREFAPDALVVLSADAVYKLDYGEVVDAHAQSGAAVTMVTTEVEPGDAGRYGVVQRDGERITDYVYKPDEPATNTISNEVFVFTPEEVLDRLDALAESPASSRTSATSCSRSSWTTAAPARTRSTATGATSARSTRSTPRTWSSSSIRRRSTSTTPSGRSSPTPPRGERARACSPARRSTAACSRPRRRSAAPSSAP